MTPKLLRNAVAAAFLKQPHSVPPGPPQEVEAGPLIPVITINGFTLLESEGAQPESNERRFFVKSPTGGEHEGLVTIMKKRSGSEGNQPVQLPGFCMTASPPDVRRRLCPAGYRPFEFGAMPQLGA